MAEFADQVQRIARLREFAADAGWNAAAAKLRRFAAARLRLIRRRLNDAQVRAVDTSLGARQANVYFWQGPGRHPGWTQTQERLELLFRIEPGEVDHFVSTSLELSSDPMVVVGLARHPLSHRPARTWIEHDWRHARDDLAERLAPNRLLGAAVASVAELVMDPAEAAALVRWAERLYQIADPRFQQLMDSNGYSFSIEQRVPTRVARNRLVIAEQFRDVDAISLHFLGAERVSILATSDTFGRADFTKYRQYPDVGLIEVEHIRTRTPRFSQSYIDLHEATAEVARAAASAIADVPGLVAPDIRPFLEVATADFLFFQALKVRAIVELLRDDSIDDIVIAVPERGRANEFLRLIAGVEGLLVDPRVRIASVTRSGRERTRFWNVIEALRIGEVSQPAKAMRLPDGFVVEMVQKGISHLADSLDVPPQSEKPTLLFVAAAAAAYSGSVAGYVDALSPMSEVQVLCMGGGAPRLAAELEGSTISGFNALAPAGNRFDSLSELLHAAVLTNVSTNNVTDAGRAAQVAIRLSSHRLGREVVGPLVSTVEALDRFLTRSCEQDRLPQVVLLCPHRTVWVAASAAVARRFKVPSLALEPHAQDANYSRYTKIAADYYGVLSDHFRTQVAVAFGIGLERTRTIGSPRQIAPSGYDPVAAQRSALDLLPLDSVLRQDRLRLVFFCQPSAWNHVDTIWTSLLRAADREDCVVLLKTHPEESVTRAQMYLDRAEKLGLRSRVVPLDTDAEGAIALGDVVVTAYSAAAFDAVVRGTPVIVLTDEDLAYPVDLQAIFGVPVARSSEDLSALIRECQSNPAALRGRILDFLERETQLVEGPGPRLARFLSDVLEMGSAGVRDAADIPESLFLDGPHPTFPV